MNGLTIILYSQLFYLLPVFSRTLAASLNHNSGHNVRHGKSKADVSELIRNSFHSLQPSRVLIPVDLQETANEDLDPDLDNLNEGELLRQLGDGFQRRYMSIRQPMEALTFPNGTLEFKFKKHKMVPKGQQMPVEIQALMQKTIKLSDDGPELQVKFDRRTRRKLQRFLWAYSYCPVRYKWKQLSIRFWPRWIKVGECHNQRSCSIPAGMTCQPSQMMNLDVLRYYCPFSSPSGRTCQWIRIKYPVLKECSCGCQNYSDQYKT